MSAYTLAIKRSAEKEMDGKWGENGGKWAENGRKMGDSNLF